MERIGLLLGGAAIGAAGMVAVQSMTDKKAVPTVRPPMPAPAAQSGPAIPTQPPNRIELAKEILPFGIPGPISDVIYRTGYISSFNRRDRNPNWTAEHLTADKLSRRDGSGGGDRQNSQFKEDVMVPVQFRARMADYFRSGYDRGHMVPAADCKQSQQAMNDTFYLTNIAPQVGDGFNRDYWAHFENFTRQLTKQFSDVWVYTGPLYLPHQDPISKKWFVKYEVISNPDPNVAVPTHFYKVIMTLDKRGNYATAAFVLPNAPIANETPLETFKVPIDAVERASGLVFFDRFPGKVTGVAGSGPLPGVRELCRETQCRIVVNEFLEAKKRQEKAQARLP